LKQALNQAAAQYHTLTGEHVLQRGIDAYETGSTPVAHCLRLKYGALHMELETLSAVGNDPSQLWLDKPKRIGWLLECFRRAQSAMEHWLVIFDQYKEISDALEGTDVSALKRQLAEAEQSVNDLVSYRQRFKDLHERVAEEAIANKEFQAGLQAVIEGEVMSPDKVRMLISSYKNKRQPLDAYLERSDVSPIDDRKERVHYRLLAVRKNQRSRSITNLSARRIQESTQAIKAVSQRQRGIVDLLQDEFTKDENEKTKLLVSYQQQIKHLEQSIVDSEECIATLERENNRRQRMIDDLLKRLEEGADTSNEVKVLQQTIDRFSNQAMEMAKKMYGLESEIRQLRARNEELEKAEQNQGGQDSLDPVPL
jgi:hypothetical protein